jgi:membrane-bound lytic murein transglycosylase A
VVPYPARADLADSPALRGKALVWVDDPVAAFFLQVQGSGRVQLYEHGQPRGVIRLAYADQNGQPYRSIGRWLVEQGELTLDHVSMQAIQEWAQAHPERLPGLLNVNPSVVFFKEAPLADPHLGPVGSLGVPLSPGRSIAVDIRIVTLGAPVFLATTQPNSDLPLDRLTFAQDTGGAIQASPGQPVRADLFWGFGEEAATQAGRMKQPGRMWILLPRGVGP